MGTVKATKKSIIYSSKNKRIYYEGRKGRFNNEHYILCMIHELTLYIYCFDVKYILKYPIKIKTGVCQMSKYG